MADVVGLPPGLTSRPAVMADLDEVVAVVHADETADRGSPDASPGDVAGSWSRPSFDLATQSVVVLDDGRVVAFGESANHRAWIRVHPDHHGQGIGNALLAWAEEAGRERGEAYIGQTVFDGNAAALDLHRRRGYRVRWETWLLGIDLDEPVAVPPVPPGCTLRRVDLEHDAIAVYAAIDEAFNTWTARDPSNFDDWYATYWEHEDLAVEQSFVVEDEGGTVIGACLCVVEDDEGVVDQLAVVPAHHGRGLGGLLLLSSFAAFRDTGLRAAVLSTESRATARSFYEHLGMRLTRSFTRFVKDL